MRKCSPNNCDAFEMCEFIGQDIFLHDCETAKVENKLENVPDGICKQCDALLGGRWCVGLKVKFDNLACDCIRFSAEGGVA